MFAGESHQAWCPAHFVNPQPWMFVRLTPGSLTKWLPWVRGVNVQGDGELVYVDLAFEQD